jgi:hypothetical protein
MEVFNILVFSMYNMSDITYNEWDLASSMSELESLGLETPKLNELNDSYEVQNLVENLKQTKDYKSMHVFTD